MRDMRGEVGKKTHKKEMDNPSFVTWLILETLCRVTIWYKKKLGVHSFYLK